MSIKTYFFLIFIFLLFYVQGNSQGNSQSYLLEGSCEIYSTAGNNLNNINFFAYDFRDTWSSATQIRYDGAYFLLFYDRTNGQAVLLNEDMTFRRLFNNWRKTWTHILAHDLDSDGDDELLLFDISAGFAEIYALGTYLELIPKGNYSGLRNTWKDIICLDQNNDRKNEFLFYDAKNRTANVYKISPNSSGNYKLDSLWGSTYWKHTWKILKKITFADGGKGVLAYDPFNENKNGHISLFRYNNSPSFFTEIYLNEDYPKNITTIESGNFGGGLPNGDILFYMPEKGDCFFYRAGNNNLIAGPVDLDWRNSWNFISALKAGNSLDNILFYVSPNNTQLTVKSYDGTNQGIHPDIIKGHDGKYKMVFTPFPFSDDDFENPSVLESTDGYNFTEIQGTRKPLINMPLPPPNFSRAYNNDPDVLYETGKYYMVYNETFAVKDKFYQNVKMVAFDSNFCNPDSNTILIQPNYFRITFSPSLIKNNNTYYMFFVSRTAQNTHKVSFISNKSIRYGWDKPIIQNVVFNTTQDFQPWHLNVFKNNFDGYYYMLITGKYKIASSKNNDLYIARSRDLTRWTLAPEPLMRKENYACSQVYRSAGMFENKNMLTLWYSFFLNNDETGISYRKYIYVDSNTFNGRQINNTINSDVIQLANYPNPFNAMTRINFNLPGNAVVTLKIYDVLGREVKRLLNSEYRPAGNYTADFNGKYFASGVYYCKIVITGEENFTTMRRMVLIK